MNEKILVLGDYKAAKWHPLKGVDDCLKQILKDYEVSFSEEYSSLCSCELKKYDALICYADAWNSNATKQTAGAILSYAAEGGALVTIHNGIITRSNPEVELMHGARFTGHPEACDLTYTPVDLKHPILEGIKPFTIFEEPYRFTVAELAKTELLITYSHEGKDWPAAWTLFYGMGKIAYLSMGHSAKSFENETFARLIVNSVVWASTKEGGDV